MRCKCGHSDTFHAFNEGDDKYDIDELGACEECDDCQLFRLDSNWEPPDPPGWEAGFADNH